MSDLFKRVSVQEDSQRHIEHWESSIYRIILIYSKSSRRMFMEVNLTAEDTAYPHVKASYGERSQAVHIAIQLASSPFMTSGQFQQFQQQQATAWQHINALEGIVARRTQQIQQQFANKKERMCVN